jgi:hypothetical protein
MVSREQGEDGAKEGRVVYTQGVVERGGNYCT